MYFDPDEDDDEALKGLQPPPAAVTAPPPEPERPVETPPAPQMAPPAYDVPDPQAEEEPGAYAFQKPEPDKPESVSLLDDEGAQWAALLDTLMNGGRGVGKILGAAAVQKSKKESQGLDNEYKRAQIQHLRGGGNAEQLELRRQALALQAQGLDLAYGKEGRIGRGQDWRQGQKERDQDPNSPAARATQDWAYKNFPDEFPRGSLDRLSTETWRIVRGLIEKKAEVSQPIATKRARNAGLTEANRTQAQIDIENESRGKIAETEAAKVRARQGAELENAEALAAARSRGSAAGRGNLQERQYQERRKEAFRKDNKEELDVFGLISEIERSGGVTTPDSQSFLENAAINSPAVAARLVDPKRLDSIAAHRLILEIWGRALTGKAGTSAEDQRFAAEAGAKAMQSPADVEASFRQLRGVVQRRLRSAAHGNPAAIDLMGIYVDDPYTELGYSPEEVNSWRAPAGSGTTPPRTGAATPQPGTTQAPSNVPTPREQTAAQEAGQPPPPNPLDPNDEDNTVEELQALEPPLPNTGAPAPSPPVTHRDPTIPELEHQLRTVEALVRAQPNQLPRLEKAGRSPDDIRALIDELRRRSGPKKPKKRPKQQADAEDLLRELGN